MFGVRVCSLRWRKPTQWFRSSIAMNRTLGRCSSPRAGLQAMSPAAYAEAMERVRDEVNALPSVKAVHRNLQMKLVGAAAHVEPDANGRITLPGSQRTATGIEKRAVLLGMGNKFELWGEQAHLAKIRETIGEDQITEDMLELRL